MALDDLLVSFGDALLSWDDLTFLLVIVMLHAQLVERGCGIAWSASLPFKVHWTFR